MVDHLVSSKVISGKTPIVLPRALSTARKLIYKAPFPTSLCTRIQHHIPMGHTAQPRQTLLSENTVPPLSGRTSIVLRVLRIILPAAVVLPNPPLSDMGRLAEPLHGLGSMLLPHNVDQEQELEILLRVQLEWIGDDIGESPLSVGFERHDQTVWLCGRPHAEPCSARVHCGEVPFLLAVVLRDECADHRLAFVHREQIFDDLSRLLVNRGGFDEKIEDCWENLGG